MAKAAKAKSEPQTQEPKDPRDSMNSMYKLTRHVYDASRRFYLLGRDFLIQNLNAKPNEDVIEVGCGTARNLVQLQARYPKTKFYGIDASDEMLKTAEKSLARLQLDTDIPLMQGLAQTFEPEDVIKKDKNPDKIVFSYVLSMIPDANDAVDHALDVLEPGGEIHIVDFCHLKRQPAFFRAILKKWLAMFHVQYDPKLLRHIQSLAENGRADVNFQSLYKDYAYYALIKKTQ